MTTTQRFSEKMNKIFLEVGMSIPDSRFLMFLFKNTKGQLNSEWIIEVIVSTKMPTKNLKDFCTTL